MKWRRSGTARWPARCSPTCSSTPPTARPESTAGWSPKRWWWPPGCAGTGGVKGSAEMVAAAIRTIFAQPDAAHVHEQLDVIAGMLGRQFPALETMLRDSVEELLAFTSFPVSHWKKIWSTNPLERLNKEIKRRTDVVGVLPQATKEVPPAQLMPA